jgi:hypothetical protein
LGSAVIVLLSGNSLAQDEMQGPPAPSGLYATEQELPREPPVEPSDGLDKKKAEVYFAVHGFRSKVRDLQVRDVTGQSFQFPTEDGWGGGAKIGIYIPPVWKISFGGEIETYLFRNAVMAPDAANGLNSPAIRQHLEVWNFMLNLLARYPGQTYQPYIGVGFGASGVEIRGGRETLFSQTDAYQFFGGIRVLMSDRWFTFTEYKMIYANYQYDCNPQPCLTQNINYNAFLKPASSYISIGVGFRLP